MRGLGHGRLHVLLASCVVAAMAALALALAAAATASSQRTTNYVEHTGSPGSGTFTNYTNAGGTVGQRIGAYQAVEVTCALRGFVVQDGNPWWYQIASSPWNNAFYAPADNFYNNGQTSGSLSGTPFVDPAVPLCGSNNTAASGTRTTAWMMIHFLRRATCK